MKIICLRMEIEDQEWGLGRENIGYKLFVKICYYTWTYKDTQYLGQVAC